MMRLLQTKSEVDYINDDNAENRCRVQVLWNDPDLNEEERLARKAEYRFDQLRTHLSTFDYNC